MPTNQPQPTGLAATDEVFRRQLTDGRLPQTFIQAHSKRSSDYLGLTSHIPWPRVLQGEGRAGPALPLQRQ